MTNVQTETKKNDLIVAMNFLPEFVSKVLPKIKIQRNRGNVWKFEGKAFVNDKLVAEAIYSAMIMEP